MLGKRRTWRFKTAVVVTAALLALGFSEFLLYVVGVSYPRPYIPDPLIGTRLQPGFSAWFGKEGGAHVSVNSRGFRDQEYDTQRPSAALRIAVLGDSYVEAMQIELEDTFWKVLERELNRSGTSAEVRGFGISGFGTAQELLTYRHYVKSLKPDVVILAMTLANDVRNNSRELEPVQERPFFDLIDGQLVEDRSFLRHPAYVQAGESSTAFKTALINSSRLLQLVAELKGRVGQVDGEPKTEQGLDVSVYRPPTQVDWDDAWNITEALLLQLNNEVTADGAKLVVVTLTAGIQVHPDASVYEAACRQLGVSDLSYADVRIAALCAEHSIPVVNLAEPMRKSAQSQRVWYHGFENTELGSGHWNVDGHQVAGAIISRELNGSDILAGRQQPVSE